LADKIKTYIFRIIKKENQFEDELLTTRIMKTQTEEKTLTISFTKWFFQGVNISESPENAFFEAHSDVI
jgi:predicted HNH restriction endonuclease